MDVLVSESFLRGHQDWAAAQPVRWGAVDADERLSVRGPGGHVLFSPVAAWLSQDLWSDPALGAFLSRLEGAEDLHWVQTCTAGTDALIVRRLLARGVRVSTSHGQAEGIADYVLAGVLDSYQRGADRRRAQASRRWTMLPFRELGGTRWLLIGYGHIGRAVAARALAFGAEVTALRRSGRAERAVSTAPIDALRDKLPEADIVVLCLPGTPETEGLIGAAAVGAMKPGSILVNVARGSLVDEAALLEGLDRGAPGLAILDVAAREPPSRRSPLWAHPRVVLTAHTSWASDGAARRNHADFRDNLERFVRGETPRNLVAPVMEPIA